MTLKPRCLLCAFRAGTRGSWLTVKLFLCDSAEQLLLRWVCWIWPLCCPLPTVLLIYLHNLLYVEARQSHSYVQGSIPRTLNIVTFWSWESISVKNIHISLFRTRFVSLWTFENNRNKNMRHIIDKRWGTYILSIIWKHMEFNLKTTQKKSKKHVEGFSPPYLNCWDVRNKWLGSGAFSHGWLGNTGLPVVFCLKDYFIHNGS